MNIAYQFADRFQRLMTNPFVTDEVNILARPISQLCNLSVILNSCPRISKTKKVKLLLKKPPKLTLKTTALFYYSFYYEKLLKGLLMTKLRNV